MTPFYLDPRYAGDAFDELSFWSSRFGALMLDHLELRTNVRGLDLACGAGFPLIELAHVHGPGSHFTGIDIWFDALVRARGKLPIFGDTNIEVVNANVYDLPFAAASFDLITSNLGINNFDDPAAALRECRRVARDGARIALTTNLTGHMAELYAIFRELIDPSLLGKLNAQEAHRGTRDSVSAALTGSGFRITNVVEDEFHLHFASGTALMRHHLVQFFLGGWKSVTEDAVFYAAVEERLNRMGELRMRVPMLYIEGEAVG